MNSKITLQLFLGLLIVMASFISSPQSTFAAGRCAVVDVQLDKYLEPNALPNVPVYCTVGAITQKLMNIAFVLIGGVAVLFAIIGGYRYMMAGGSEEQTTQGKKTFLYAIAGLAVVILAGTLVNIVINLVLHGKTI